MILKKEFELDGERIWLCDNRGEPTARQWRWWGIVARCVNCGEYEKFIRKTTKKKALAACLSKHHLCLECGG